MSPSEAAFWSRVQRKAASLSPDLSKAILDAFARIRASMSESEFAALIRSASVERLLSEGLPDTLLDDAFRPLSNRLVDGVQQAAGSAAKDLPRVMQTPGFGFGILNPRIIYAIRELDTRVITTLKASIRETVRQHVEAGLQAGTAPRTIARGLRETIGLAPNQEAAVRAFKRKLEEGGMRALENKLRDRRFDAAIKRGGLSPERIEKMTEAYRKRFVAFNAETNARTAALDAQKLGQRLSWEDAIARGVVDRNRLVQRWIGVMDSRERPEHREMEGEEVGFDDAFSNGEVTPGSSTFNCRCLARVFVARVPAFV